MSLRKSVLCILTALAVGVFVLAPSLEPGSAATPGNPSGSLPLRRASSPGDPCYRGGSPRVTSHEDLARRTVRATSTPLMWRSRLTCRGGDRSRAASSDGYEPVIVEVAAVRR